MNVHALVIFLGIVMISSTIGISFSDALLPENLPEVSQAPDRVRIIEGENIIAYARALLTTVDDPANHLTPFGDPYDGVAILILPNSDGNTYLCSGALLPTGQHVLTAAHCVTDEFGNDALESGGTATFARNSSSEEIAIIDFEVHPLYDGDFIKGNDIAILILENPASGDIVRYNYDMSGNAVREVVTKVGYGVGGYFNLGWKVCNEHDPCQSGDTLVYPSGFKRNGLNEYDALADVMYQALGLDEDSDYVPEAIYQYDSDNNNSSNDAFGFFFGIPDSGLGINEVISAPGDSGGPSLVDTTNDGIPDTVVGITSYGITLEYTRGPFPRTSDCTIEEGIGPGGDNPILDSSCGEFAGDTRVSYFSSWIDTIISTQPNNPPTANDDSANTDEDTAVVIDVLFNDSNGDGTIDPTTVTVTSGPTNGQTSVDGASGDITYTPDPDYNGGDSFTYTVKDDQVATSNEALVTITVNPVSDPPIADAGPDQPVNTGDMVNLDGSASSDPDGDPLTYSWSFSSKPAGSTADLSDSTIVNPTFTADLEGDYVVQLVVNDSVTNSAPDDVTITVSEPLAGVSVDDIDPNSVQKGQSVPVTINGSGFVSGASVSLSNGSGPTPTISNVIVVDGNTITATITAKSGGPPRDSVWDVTVTNTDLSSDTLAGSFTVTPN